MYVFAINFSPTELQIGFKMFLFSFHEWNNWSNAFHLLLWFVYRKMGNSISSSNRNINFWILCANYICMYVYMYMCLYIYLYVMYVRTYVCMHVFCNQKLYQLSCSFLKFISLSRMRQLEQCVHLLLCSSIGKWKPGKNAIIEINPNEVFNSR